MKYYLLILPMAMLVTYSQLIVKWRTSSLGDLSNLSLAARLLKFCLDPFYISAYMAALLASFAWLFVITKLELTVAFPIYIGVTFVMVLLGGCFLLSEIMTPAKVLAATLIFSGIVVGVMAEAG